MATLTAKEVAEKLDTDARTFRKFVRAEVKAAGGEVGVDTPGKGKRYTFESKEIRSLTKRFQAWDEARRAPKQEDEALETEETDDSSDETLEEV